MRALEPAGASLAVPDVVATSTSLDLPDGMGFNAWQRLGDELEASLSANLWWVADWAAYGDRVYRRSYGAALERIWSRKSLQNMASVARHVESSRRREDLSFGHHVEVSSLDADWQTVWLDDALTHDWSRNELRERIAVWRAAQAGRTPRTAFLVVRVPASLGDLCARAANVVGMPPAEWAARVLEQAARETIAEAA